MLHLSPRLGLLRRRFALAAPLPRLHMTVSVPTSFARRSYHPSSSAGEDRWNLSRGSPTIVRQELRLRTEADAHPGDPRKQLAYYEVLMRDPISGSRRVIERFEAAHHVRDASTLKVYIKALSQAGALHRLDSVDLSPLVPQMEHQYDDYEPRHENRSAHASHDARSMMMAAGTEQSPINVRMEKESIKSRLGASLLNAAAFACVVGLAIYVLPQIFSDRIPGIAGGKNANAFTEVNVSDVTFDDVKGCDEAKNELEEIVLFLKEPTKFTRLGGELPRGVLLTGPPGVGKTLLAKAVAGEADVPFFSCSGSQFEEMYVGVGARRVRNLFETARKRAPCLIFIDEIDGIGGSRRAKDQHAMRLTLNQLLTELDGFEKDSGIIVIAATNFADSLDQALVRPGRFDRRVAVPLPDLRGRRQILDLYMSKLPVGTDVDSQLLARATTGYSGADLSSMCNDAAIHASMSEKVKVTMEDFEYAKDKMFMGPERKSAFLTAENRKNTAYHEGGHALVAVFTDGAMPVYKATIMPRGQALGMVHQVRKGDQTSVSKKQMLARMDVCLGGRLAEELTFGEENATTGASNDLQQATRIARRMVINYGFSKVIGLVDCEQDYENLSTRTKEKVDNEVQQLITESEQRVRKLLQDRHKELKLLAEELIDKETLEGKAIYDLMGVEAQ